MRPPRIVIATPYLRIVETGEAAPSDYLLEEQQGTDGLGMERWASCGVVHAAGANMRALFAEIGRMLAVKDLR